MCIVLNKKNLKIKKKVSAFQIEILVLFIHLFIHLFFKKK